MLVFSSKSAHRNLHPFANSEGFCLIMDDFVRKRRIAKYPKLSTGHKTKKMMKEIFKCHVVLVPFTIFISQLLSITNNMFGKIIFLFFNWGIRCDVCFTFPRVKPLEASNESDKRGKSFSFTKD